MFSCAPSHGADLTFHIAHTTTTPQNSARNAAWSEVLSAVGLFAANESEADIVVTPSNAAANPELVERVERGTILILEGASPLAASFGFIASDKQVAVRSVIDERSPKLGIVWQDAVTIPRFAIPVRGKVFAKEKWDGAPLLVGFREGAGAVLWLATGLGERGYSRYPYLPQALAELGFEAPFRAANLWAFFDSSYRTRADLDYLAPRWRKAGISALHIAAWHYWERDPEQDAYLRRLIEACHRNAIQVYAWVELPHVSEKFWEQHPEWREKTALGQDAQLDWRKLMNLTNRDAFAAVSTGLHDLISTFDWDGVNLAELYFESLEGIDNAARFTPMNDDVRREFKNVAGVDPAELFKSVSANAPVLLRFLDFRAELARKQQTEWMAEIEKLRSGPNAPKPWLDLVLTHVDDRLDTSMRAKIGADTSKTLPLLKQHDFTFLIEDPATLWDLGPQRYPQIASRYVGLAPRPEKLAIDINIVERYQDVYPTKQQTGSELFQLLHVAGQAFPRVTLYFENSILPLDLPLLAASAAQVDHAESSGIRVRKSSAAQGIDSSGVTAAIGSTSGQHRAISVATPGAAILVNPIGSDSIRRDAGQPAADQPSGQLGSGQPASGSGGTNKGGSRSSGATEVADGTPYDLPTMKLSSKRSVGVAWPLTEEAPGVLVDGELWPIGDQAVQWLPAGAHTIQPSAQIPPLRVLDLNADLRTAAATADGVEFVYES
ncbi:MAG: hypothetical protein ABI824_14410, partial [Acidobacteriota bacterium]